MFDNVSVDPSIDRLVSRGIANATVVPKPGEDFMPSRPPIFLILSSMLDKPSRLRFRFF